MFVGVGLGDVMFVGVEGGCTGPRDRVPLAAPVLLFEDFFDEFPWRACISLLCALCDKPLPFCRRAMIVIVEMMMMQ
jgi:hypothetical protein